MSCEDVTLTNEQADFWLPSTEDPVCSVDQNDHYIPLDNSSAYLRVIEEGGVEKKKTFGEILLSGLQGALTIFPFYVRPAYAEEKKFVTNGDFSPYQQASEAPQLTGNTLAMKRITGPTDSSLASISLSTSSSSSSSHRVGSPKTIQVRMRTPTNLGRSFANADRGAKGYIIGCTIADTLGINVCDELLANHLGNDKRYAAADALEQEQIWEISVSQLLDGGYIIEDATFIADVQQSQQRTLTSGESRRQTGRTSQGSGSVSGNGGRTTKTERERQAEWDERQRDREMRDMSDTRRQASRDRQEYKEKVHTGTNTTHDDTADQLNEIIEIPPEEDQTEDSSD